MESEDRLNAEVLSTILMFTEDRKQIITEKVFEILHNNGLSREDIKRLVKSDSPDDSDDRTTLTAEEITALLIAEELTVMEVVDVLQIIKGTIS